MVIENKKVELVESKDFKYRINVELLKQCLTLWARSGKEQEDEILDQIVNIVDEVSIKHGFEPLIHWEIDIHGNIYITKGKSTTYPCFVAHSDQVGGHKTDKTIFQNGDFLYAMSGPDRIDCGADDLSGVYICIQALIDLSVCKVAIYVEEEIGCLGSKKADTNFFKDCRYVFQFDRGRNTRDFINHTNGVTICNGSFKDYCKLHMDLYGFIFNNGSITDVGQLVKNGLDICAANIFTGYYKAHSSDSYQSVSELENSYNMVMSIINSVGDTRQLLEKDVIIPKKVEDPWYKAQVEEIYAQYKFDYPSKVAPQFLAGLKAGIEYVIDNNEDLFIGNDVEEEEIDNWDHFGRQTSMYPESNRYDYGRDFLDKKEEDICDYNACKTNHTFNQLSGSVEICNYCNRKWTN